MKKQMRIIGWLPLLFFSCTQNEQESTISENELNENDFISYSEENAPEVTEELILEKPIEENSIKSKLIGNWQDENDASLQVVISPTHYSTIIDGRKNWYNRWDTSNTLEYDETELNDNGIFILVYLDAIGDVFYVQEIINITENNLEARVVKGSGGLNENIRFKRIL